MFLYSENEHVETKIKKKNLEHSQLCQENEILRYKFLKTCTGFVC